MLGFPLIVDRWEDCTPLLSLGLGVVHWLMPMKGECGHLWVPLLADTPDSWALALSPLLSCWVAVETPAGVYAVWLWPLGWQTSTRRMAVCPDLQRTSDSCGAIRIYKLYCMIFSKVAMAWQLSWRIIESTKPSLVSLVKVCLVLLYLHLFYSVFFATEHAVEKTEIGKNGNRVELFFWMKQRDSISMQIRR